MRQLLDSRSGCDEFVIKIRPEVGLPTVAWREMWAYRELLYFLFWRNIKIRYKQTLLGALWALLQPTLTMAVFSIFFGHLGRMPSDGIPYPLFSYAALLPWTLFANGLTLMTNHMLGSANLIKKVYFPRLLIPVASMITGLVDFLLASLVLFAMMRYYDMPLTPRVLLLGPILLLAVCASLGAGCFLSSLNVKFRDVGHTMPFIIQFWMFCTPVAYPSSLVGEKWAVLYGLNPMSGVIDAFRWCLLAGAAPPTLSMAASVCSALLLLAFGVLYFRRMERSFADII